MAQNTPAFTFSVSTLDHDTFHVVRFEGSEGLSKLYEFEILLLSDNASIDFGKALKGTATLSIKRGQQDVQWHGILRDFQQLQRMDKHVYYRAILTPKAWWLTQTRHNQIFLDKDVSGFLRDALSDGGLSSGLDYELQLNQSYAKREYVCQHDETHFNFVSRWMERFGLYYYFDQSGQAEKMVIVDSLSAHAPHPAGDTLLYAEPSGLDANIAGKAAKNFQCAQRRLPKDVLVKDYNYSMPSVTIEGKAQVSQDGMGTMYYHGDHLRTNDEAAMIAKVRAGELLCREKIFSGESNAGFLQPGYTVELKDHYRDSFNQNYLVTDVKHQGSQEAWLTSGLGLTVQGLGDALFYRNTFEGIPASVQFRAQYETEKPRIYGALNAKVDAQGSGEYAELDSQGRYKVILPFDLSGRKEGHASAWVRMAQPYAGQGHGMHFPLHKGTEVMLIHYEGDPDRPAIAAAVPNAETTSMVTSQNQTMNAITTSGGNQIHMEDMDGSQRILLSSPTQSTFVRIGSHNDPDDPPESEPPKSNWEQAMDPDGLKLYSAGPLTIKAAYSFELILGNKNEITVGVLTDNVLLERHITTIGFFTEIDLALHGRYGPEIHELKGSVQEAAAAKEQAFTNLEQLVGQHTTTIGQHTTTIGQHTNTIGDHTNTIGQHTQTIGDHTNTIGQHTQTIGDHTNTIGQNTQTIGDHTNTIGQHTQTIGDHTNTIGQHTQTIGDHTQTIGQLTQTAADVTRLAENVSVLATAIEYI